MNNPITILRNKLKILRHLNHVLRHLLGLKTLTTTLQKKAILILTLIHAATVHITITLTTVAKFDTILPTAILPIATLEHITKVLNVTHKHAQVTTRRLIRHLIRHVNRSSLITRHRRRLLRRQRTNQSTKLRMRQLRVRRATARQRYRRITSISLNKAKFRRIRLLQRIHIHIRIILHLPQSKGIKILKRLLRSCYTMIQPSCTLFITHIKVRQRRTNRSFSHKHTNKSMQKNRQRRQLLQPTNLR